MKGKSAKGVLAVLLTTLAAVGIFVAYSAVTASAQGRTIDGVFCMDHPFCMQASFDDQTVMGYQVASNTPSGAVITLQPGTYWFTVHDDMSGHDFALRSCPGSDSPCTPGNGSGMQITTPGYNCNNDTTVADACATGVTTKILLTTAPTGSSATSAMVATSTRSASTKAGDVRRHRRRRRRPGRIDRFILWRPSRERALLGRPASSSR